MPLRALFLCCLLDALVACGRSAPVPELSARDRAGLDPELSRAVEAARARVLEAPRDLGAWAELAMVFEANEIDAPAEEAWTCVTAHDDENPHPWYSLARVRERRGDVPGALAALERGLAFGQDYAPARARHGRLLLG